jgi:hypothetical protein
MRKEKRNSIVIRRRQLHPKRNDDKGGGTMKVIKLWNLAIAAFLMTAGRQDMLLSPTLGAGVIPNGTYNCVMLRMDDQIKFAPSVSDGDQCDPATEYTQDIANTGSGDLYDPDRNLIGTSSPAHEENVWIYFRVDGPALGGNSFDPQSGMKLAAPVVVTGDKEMTVVFDFRNQIKTIDTDGAGPNPPFCNCEQPILNIR